MNRAHLVTPTGEIGTQDKQIMTRFERETWDVASRGPLTLFDSALGKIGALICYDSEFPLLGRALAEADVILAPSCTEALSGYSRMWIGAMARALENESVMAMAPLVGAAAWSEAVDVNTGHGGIFGPPDKGFPETGVIRRGRDEPPRVDLCRDRFGGYCNCARRWGCAEPIGRNKISGGVRSQPCVWVQNNLEKNISWAHLTAPPAVGRQD